MTSVNRETIYYDGKCGFCHRWVKTVLKHDAHNHFDFAPRDSKHFRAQLSEGVRERLPRSILVVQSDGTVLTHSTATLYILEKMGRGCRLLSKIGGLCPRFLRDLGYTVVSRIRGRIYATPAGMCPIVPAEHRHRFKD